MFTIPNSASAEDGTQAQVDSRDFDTIVAAFSGTGVVSGCAVTPQGTPNMTVAVAAGTVAVAGSSVAVTGGNVTITAANPTNPRFDLVCVDNAGVKSAVAGTPAASPVFPDPAGKVVLAAVRVPASVASINAAKIVDKRVAAILAAPSTFTAGMMMPFSGSAAPAGWQLCDGSAISRTTYATLFALIGTTYGVGDGSTTFNVPDLRGRMPVGYAASGGHTDVATLGNNDGTALASRRPKHSHTNGLTLPNHVHSITDPGHTHTIVDIQLTGANNIQLGTPQTNLNSVSTPTSSATTGITVGNPTTNPAIGGTVGVAGPVDSAGYQVVNFIIKL